MARSFNGTSDKIAANAAHSFSEQAAFSVSFWALVPAGSQHGSIYTETRSTSSAPWIDINYNSAVNSANIIVQIRNDAGGTQQLSSTFRSSGSPSFADGNWHHYVFTQDGSGNYATYCDGIVGPSGSYTPGTTTIDQLTIGCWQGNGASQFFHGSIAHVAKWSRKLSAGEAAALGAGTLPSHFGPDHYWPLFGVDSPEPDIGTATHTSGTLTGTSAAATNPPTSPYLIRGDWLTRKISAPSVSKSDSDTGSLSSSVLTAGPVSAISDSDTAAFTDPTKRNDVDHTKASHSIAVSASASDSASAAAVVSSISLSSADTLTESDAGGLTDAIPPPAPQAETFTLTSTQTLAVAVSGADAASLDSTAGAVIPSALAISDTDIAALADLGSNASGGVASAFIGVTLAFDDTALSAAPTWTRLDDPAGIA